MRLTSPQGAPPEKSRDTERHRTLAMVLVREVGFEPTNPYGTGASGLRFQDPDIVRVSLTWLGNTGDT